MVPVDVDGQICHFCSQVFVTRNKYLCSYTVKIFDDDDDNNNYDDGEDEEW